MLEQQRMARLAARTLTYIFIGILLVFLSIIIKPLVQQYDNDQASDEIPAMLRGFVFQVEFRKTEPWKQRLLFFREKYSTDANALVVVSGTSKEKFVMFSPKQSKITLLIPKRKGDKHMAPIHIGALLLGKCSTLGVEHFKVFHQ